MTRRNTFGKTNIWVIVLLSAISLATFSEVSAEQLPREFLGMRLGQTSTQTLQVLKASGSGYGGGVAWQKSAIYLCRPQGAQEVRCESITPGIIGGRLTDLHRYGVNYLRHEGRDISCSFSFLDDRLINMKFEISGVMLRGILDKLKSNYSRHCQVSGKTVHFFSDGQTVILVGQESVRFYDPRAVEDIRDLEQRHKKEKSDRGYERGRGMIK